MNKMNRTRLGTMTLATCAMALLGCAGVGVGILTPDLKDYAFKKYEGIAVVEFKAVNVNDKSRLSGSVSVSADFVASIDAHDFRPGEVCVEGKQFESNWSGMLLLGNPIHLNWSCEEGTNVQRKFQTRILPPRAEEAEVFRVPLKGCTDGNGCRGWWMIEIETMVDGRSVSVHSGPHYFDLAKLERLEW